MLLGTKVCNASNAPQEWSGITVSVRSENAVETFQKITNEKGDLQKLDITFSNQGTQIVTIDSIKIRIPLNMSIANNMQVIYGSSCMGQRPVRR